MTTKSVAKTEIHSHRARRIQLVPPAAVRRAGKRIPIIDRLPDEQSQQIYKWLKTRKLTYEKIKIRAKRKFGVTISTGALCHAYQRVSAPAPVPSRERQVLDLLIIGKARVVLYECPAGVRAWYLKKRGLKRLKIAARRAGL
jgi:hypothetical protein